MRNVRKLLVGTALAGALATGIFAAPAASAATATTASAPVAASAQSFSAGWKYFNTGGHDGRIAYQWGRKGGHYWLDFKLWDRDRRDRGFTYFDVYYKRHGKWYHFNRYSTKGFFDKGSPIIFPQDVQDIRFKGGYGWSNHYGWGGYRSYN
ncbi:hypothetical protein E1286_00750 [Nonomuraea terrae]|uniref:Uncharacterized protein n=1 Tax=Nonomuraea terrae TaxID=2530383 RepID=A0A4R4ZFE7_9ACTN|nr:hypothetical protein [Nonomuraea terrae]TDD57278.1 hypothetical protein E1286_00750 [Nonomuraea terrae]